MPIGANTMSAVSIGLCHFTTANWRVYKQTIADLLPFNDDHRQPAKPSVSHWRSQMWLHTSVAEATGNVSTRAKHAI